MAPKRFARKHLQKLWTLFTNQIFFFGFLNFAASKTALEIKIKTALIEQLTINPNRTLTPSIFSKTTAAAD